MAQIDTVLEQIWAACDLPGVREHPSAFSTYSGFPAEDTPPIPDPLPDDFAWLQNEPVQEEWDISLQENPDAKLSIPEKIAMVLSSDRYPVPQSFRYFITHPGLQRRIRSSTACYLELPNFLVETAGPERGCLIHFLSDQQWCLHWYLYLNEAGEERVLCSPNDYGMYPEKDRMGEEGRTAAAVAADGAFDIATMEMGICARSFSEFIYRFWIENELWWALEDGVPLTPAQQAYVAAYVEES